MLRAPTGAGKTWAVLLPFVLKRVEGQPLFDRVLYALPLRSLATQLYETTKKALKRVKGQDNSDAINVTIQTGEQQEDKFFQGDIIFTTIDQLLSSYLMAPVSLPRRLANINAGALIGSLIILDEFHLLDPQRSMGTVLEMFDRLNGYCSFILMTATLSDSAISWLEEKLPNTVTIDLSPEEIAIIESKKEKPTVRKWLYIDEEMSVQKILDDHKLRTLVIANTVSKAQEFYRELCRHASGKTDIRLLHSRFYPEDRKITEKELLPRLGKDSQNRADDFILVSTQVVEAGMDFSVDHLYSELAPINSLIQRAGRCARYGGEGTVTVFRSSGYLPYGKADMDATAALLHDLSGKTCSWEEEREAVNKVLGMREITFLSSYGNLYSRRGKVNLAMDGVLESARDELIRDVNNVNVIVTEKPESIRLDRVASWPEMLSVPIHSMQSFLKKVADQIEDNWLVKAPYTDDFDEDIAVRFRWRELNASEVPSAWLLAINPKFAAYSAELGLVLGESGKEMDVRYRDLQIHTRYHYIMETFPEHVKHVLEQYHKQEKEYLCSSRLLAKHLDITEEMLEKAGILAGILHDAGKLAVDWQSIARKHQEFKTPGKVPSVPLSHMEYDPCADRSVPKRPSHAVEGAYAVCGYLFNVFDGAEGIAASILTAIARHHAGHAAKLGSFILDSTAVACLNDCLLQEGLPGASSLLDQPDESMRGGQFSRELISACNEEDSKWLLLYWYIVRRLRLADQAGTAEGGKK